jgi:NADH-quinone oxidoreductase subunit G
MCLCEVEGMPKLQAACTLTAQDGMVLKTAATSEQAADGPQGVLEFLLLNHPLDCPDCDKGGECPLQDHTMSFGPGESRFVEEKRHYEKPIPISDHVLLDRERCILCDRCTRFAKDVAGDALIHFQDRGNGTQVNTFPDHPFASYFAGNTVQICPVGALTAKPYRFKARPWDLDVVESTCTECAVGCRIVIDGSRNEVLRYAGVDSDPVNWGWLCDKGRFGFEAVGAPERLSAPLVREGQDLVEVRWADALAAAAKAVRGGLDRSGPGGTAVIGGSRLTNEAAYAWAKLAKGVIGTDHVDAQLGDGLPAEVVAGLPRATIDEACAAGGTLLVIGSDPKDELPVLFLRIRDAVTRHQATVIELAAHDTSLTPLAAHSLRTTPGAVDEMVTRLVAGDDDLGPVRDRLAAGPFTVLLGRSSYAEGPDSIVAAAAKLLTAFPDVRFLSGLRRANVHGAIDMGLAPGLLPGRVALDDGRAWFSSEWATLPAEVGLDTAGILAAAADGQIDTLVLLGADPMTDFPDAQLARRGLAGARTVISVGTFLDDSARQADIVLPAAGFAETEGTTTNIEGRVTTLGRKVTPPGTARPDWMIAAELALRLGADLGFEDPAAIWAEIGRLSPVHRDMTPAALAATADGLLAGRPVDTAGPADADGSPAGSGAPEDGGRPPADAVDAPAAIEAEGEPQPVTEPPADAEGATEPDAAPAAEPAPSGPAAPQPVRFDPAAVHFEAPAVDSYSLRLVTDRRLYDRGTNVAHSPSLAGLAASVVGLTANPLDLHRLGVHAGDRVKVTSSRASLMAAVQPDASVPEGTVVLPWNQGDPLPTELIEAGSPVTEVRVETIS